MRVLICAVALGIFVKLAELWSDFCVWIVALLNHTTVKELLASASPAGKGLIDIWPTVAAGLFIVIIVKVFFYESKRDEDVEQ